MNIITVSRNKSVERWRIASTRKSKFTPALTIFVVFLISLVIFFPLTKGSVTYGDLENYHDKVSSNYIETGSTEIASSYYYSSYSTIMENSDLLEYPSVYDGYLWIVQSNPWPAVLKCNLTTQEVIAQTTLPYVTTLAEYFPAYVYDGLVFVPGEDGLTNVSNGQIVIMNETTLATVAIYTIAPPIANYIISVVYDKVSQNLLFGLDSMDGNVNILAVPASLSTNTSAYRVIPVANISSSGESQIVTFNDTVYVLSTYPCGGANGTIHTRLYESKNLQDWTQVFEETGTNIGPDAYFAHLTASSDYLAVGLLSDEDTGVTTYRIEYMNSQGVWREYDSLIDGNWGEDHPSVNALSHDLFLWEPCARFNSMPHSIFVFNATSGEMTDLFIPTNSSGYNDRWVGIDVDNRALYIGDCYAPSGGSQIIKLDWNLELSMPNYFPLQYRIYASADKHSSIAANGTVFVNQGESKLFEYSSSPGYTVANVQVNGSSVPVTGNYTFTNVNDNYVISVQSDASQLSYFTIVGMPSSITAGSPINSTIVTAYDSSNNIIEAYKGTLYFASSDAKAVLPYVFSNPYIFNDSDNGQHAFSELVLKTGGLQLVTVTVGNISKSLNVMVNPAPLDHITILPNKAIITAGDRLTYISLAWDAHNNIIGAVTASTYWDISIDAGGSWNSNVYTSEYPGTWNVTASVSGVQANASLTIEAAPTPTPIPTSGATDRPTTLPSANHSSSPLNEATIYLLVLILASGIILAGTAIIITKKKSKNRNTHY